MRTAGIRLAAALGTLLSLALAAGGAPPLGAAEVPGPAMLVCLAYAEPGRPWQQGLEALGYQVKVLESPRQLTWDLLRQFNVLLVADWAVDPEGTRTDASILSPALLEVWKQAVDRFLAEGGGVLILGTPTQSDSTGGIGAKSLINELLEAYDGRMLFEQVMDPKHTYVQPRKISWRYCWTTSVAPHRATEGVRTIYYPNTAFMYSPVTAPLQVNEQWQVLVRAMDTAASHAASYPGAIHAPAFREETPGTYASAPPLVAVRQVGPGRLAVSGLSHYMSLLWQGHPAAEDICISRGDGITPSDTGKLLANLYRWLAEPSLADAKVGGYVAPPPEPLGIRSDWGAAEPIDWAKVSLGEQPQALVGMIGAHTKDGGGSGTVAEWVEAAKKAGLDWLAFTEDFAQLTPEKWEALREACRRATDDKFMAVPGIEIYDHGDNRWVQFGPNLRWWPAAWLTEDGKRVKDSQNFFISQALPPTAPICIKTNGHPPWSYRFLSAFAVFTAERGTVIDDALDGYLTVQEQEDECQPLAVNLMYDPADLSRASGFPRTYLRAPGLEGRKWFVEPGWRPWTSYISSGPRLLAWDGFNLTRSTLGEYYVPGTERWRVRLKTHAEAGLKEIRVYDGTGLYARYLPQGPEADLIIEGLHDKSRRLVAVITDQQGGQAVTPCLLIVDFLGRLQMCGDRNNTMPNSIVKGEEGKPTMYVPATMIDKGRWPLIGVRPAVDWYYLGLPGWDGGFGWSGFGAEPVVALEGWKREGFYFGRTGSVVAGKHFIIQNWRLENEYLPVSGSVPGTLNLTPYIPFKPLEPYTAEVREVALIKRARDTSLVLIEGRLKFNRDVVLDPQARPTLQLGSMWPQPKPGEYDHFALVLPGVRTIAGLLPPKEKPFTFDGPVPPGSYFATYPCLTGAQALMVLDEGYALRVEGSDNWVRGYVNLNRPGEKMAAGTVLPYRFLCVVGDYNGPATNAEFEWVRESLGINGPPAYEVQTVQGKVLATKLFLDLEAEAGGFTGVLRKTTERRLPVRLPVRVYGLNPNWSAGVYDRPRQTLEPFGIGDGVGYVSVDLDQGPADVYIGNLATCDQPEMRLWVLEEGPSHVRVVAQNPTDRELTTTIKPGAGYTRVPAFARLVTVPAGGQIEFTVGE